MSDYLVSNNQANVNRHLHTDEDCRHLRESNGVREATDDEEDAFDVCKRCADEWEFGDSRHRLYDQVRAHGKDDEEGVSNA